MKRLLEGLKQTTRMRGGARALPGRRKRVSARRRAQQFVDGLSRTTETRILHLGRPSILVGAWRALFSIQAGGASVVRKSWKWKEGRASAKSGLTELSQNCKNEKSPSESPLFNLGSDRRFSSKSPRRHRRQAGTTRPFRRGNLHDAFVRGRG